MIDAGREFNVIYVDANLLVLTKPAGLLAVPGKGEEKQDCLSRRVQQSFPGALIVHRLDMATSGLMLMALDPTTQVMLSKLFETRKIQKRYIAVVEGCVSSASAATADAVWHLIDLPIALDWPNRPLRFIHADGKPSQTRWRALGYDLEANNTRLELEPITGRSHQLRVHLKALGHPILGDALYAPADIAAKSSRLLLHACELKFTLPKSGKEMIFENPPQF